MVKDILKQLAVLQEPALIYLFINNLLNAEGKVPKATKLLFFRKKGQVSYEYCYVGW